MSATCTEDVSKQRYEKAPTGPRGTRYFCVIAASVGEAFEALGQASPSAEVFVDRSGWVPAPVIQATNYRIVKQTPAGAGRKGYVEIEVTYGGGFGGSAGKKEPAPDGPAVITKRVHKVTVQTDIAWTDPARAMLNAQDEIDNSKPILTTNKKPLQAVRTVTEHEIQFRWVQKGFNSLAYTALLDTLNRAPFGPVPSGVGRMEAIEDDERTDGYLDCSVIVVVRPTAVDWDAEFLDDDGRTKLLFHIDKVLDWSGLKIPGVNQ